MHQNNTLSIQTIEQDLPRVEQLLETYIDKKSEKYGEVLIATTEALENALTHGNKDDTTKEVTFTLQYKKNQKTAKYELIDVLTIIVTDEGAPFDPTEVPDPTDDNYIHKEGGRGLFLMNKLSHAISFNNIGSGNQVTMTFHIPVGVESEV